MTEEEGQRWIEDRFGAAAVDRVGAFLTLVARENARQNLIAPSTMAKMWVRHGVDSAQLLMFDRGDQWIDIGSGGGFPGMVVGLLRRDPVLLVEPRRRRAEFLAACVARLGLDHVEVAATKVENVDRKARVISARAVASIEKLLQIGTKCGKDGTRWLLPRGRVSDEDRAHLQSRWPGVFHVEQSLTDVASSILILDQDRVR